MTLTIDGQQMKLSDGYKNIVDLAKANGIGIPAPCYLNNRKHGCCNGCAIKVDGELKYACVTKPRDNMNIEVNTPELKELRKNNLALYKEAIDTGKTLPCNCGDCSDDSDDCGCKDSCGCEDDCCCEDDCSCEDDCECQNDCCG